MERRVFMGGLAAAGLAGPGLSGWARPALAQSSSASSASSSWADIEKAALKEGTVTVYHNYAPDDGNKIFADFKKQYPSLSVQIIRLASAQYYQRFATEYNAGRIACDVTLNSMDDIILGWDKKKWIAHWDPPDAPAIPAEMRINGAIWGIQAIRHIFAYNKSVVPPDQVPKDWPDLFKPYWKGKIGMDQPWRSVGPLLAMRFLEKKFNINTAQAFKAQNVQFFDGSAGVVQAIVRGDIQVGEVADFVLAQPLEDGAPIQPVYPTSGEAYVTNVTFATEGAPHPNAARLLTNWCLSKEGQTSIQIHSGAPGVRSDLPAPKLLPPDKDLPNLVDGRTLLNDADVDRLTADWRKTFNVL